MHLDELVVYHLEKPYSLVQSQPGPFLFVETCQRYVWIGNQFLESVPSVAHRLQGHEAYSFLLRFGSGLESKLVGETEVFGQLKNACDQYQKQHVWNLLSPIIQSLFEDIKEIRTRFLRTIGANSYGSLIRKMVDRRSTGPVLIIGAGDLASSILVYLSEFELRLWNRTKQKAEILKQELLAKYPRVSCQIFENLQMALSNTSHVIICVPQLDVLLEEISKEPSRKIIHLGLRSSETTKIENMLTLDDVIELKEAENKSRARKVAQARAACVERALLRSLGGGISAPHGWEDLFAFA